MKKIILFAALAAFLLANQSVMAFSKKTISQSITYGTGDSGGPLNKKPPPKK